MHPPQVLLIETLSLQFPMVGQLVFLVLMSTYFLAFNVEIRKVKSGQWVVLPRAIVIARNVCSIVIWLTFVHL